MTAPAPPPTRKDQKMPVDEKALREAVDRAARTARSHSHHALWAGLPTDSLERFGIALAQRIESAIRSNALEAAKPTPEPAPSPAAVQGSGVEVKALEWTQPEPDWWEVYDRTLKLGYEVNQRRDGSVRLRVPGETNYATFAGSVEEAKAAAQADYEARIRSALSPAPAAGDVREAIATVLRDYRLSNIRDDAGGDYPLVDLMSNDGKSIATGEAEIFLLADTIAAALSASASASAPGSGVPEGFALVPVDALRWLNGEHEDGFEKPEAARGNFWWRVEFKRRCAASPFPAQGETR